MHKVLVFQHERVYHEGYCSDEECEYDEETVKVPVPTDTPVFSGELMNLVADALDTEEMQYMWDFEHSRRPVGLCYSLRSKSPSQSGYCQRNRVPKTCDCQCNEATLRLLGVEACQCGDCKFHRRRPWIKACIFAQSAQRKE